MLIIGQPREGVYQVYDTDDFSIEFLPVADDKVKLVYKSEYGVSYRVNPGKRK